MAFNVRVYGHRGYQQVPIVVPKQFTDDSALLLYQPYEWAQTVSVSSVAASSSAQPVPDKTKVLRVIVAEGEAIRYEINPPNRPGGVVVAAAGSPLLEGSADIAFEQGWTISMIDAAALP